MQPEEKPGDTVKAHWKFVFVNMNINFNTRNNDGIKMSLE